MMMMRVSMRLGDMVQWHAWLCVCVPAAALGCWWQPNVRDSLVRQRAKMLIGGM